MCHEIANGCAKMAQFPFYDQCCYGQLLAVVQTIGKLPCVAYSNLYRFVVAVVVVVVVVAVVVNVMQKHVWSCLWLLL